jgi:hypothetical protein
VIVGSTAGRGANHNVINRRTIAGRALDTVTWAPVVGDKLTLSAPLTIDQVVDAPPDEVRSIDPLQSKPGVGEALQYRFVEKSHLIHPRHRSRESTVGS